MRRGKRIFRWLGAVCLAACGLLAVGACASSRTGSMLLSRAGADRWISLHRRADPLGPGLSLTIDLPIPS
jgi:hypothetical protein